MADPIIIDDTGQAVQPALSVRDKQHRKRLNDLMYKKPVTIDYRLQTLSVFGDRDRKQLLLNIPAAWLDQFVIQNDQGDTITGTWRDPKLTLSARLPMLYQEVDDTDFSKIDLYYINVQAPTALVSITFSVFGQLTVDFKGKVFLFLTD